MRQLAAALLPLLLVAALPAAAAELTVTVAGVRSDRGDIRLSVYASAAEWPDHPAPGNDHVAKARRGVVVFHLALPPGTYAVDGFHDENGNGEFDTDFVGLPEEGYCFSNDVRPFLSAPSFAAARITLPAAGTAITIHMRY